MRNDSTSQPWIKKGLGLSIASSSFSRPFMINISVVCSLLILSGCASTNNLAVGQAKPTQAQQLRTDMVNELIGVLPQILEPRSTTIQISDTESGRAAEAEPRLVKFGYGLQRVDADQGSQFMRLIEIPSISDWSTADTRLRLSVGDIELTRSYRIVKRGKKYDSISRANWRNGKAVIPVGPLKIAGTRQRIVLRGVKVELTLNDDELQEKRSYSLTDGSVRFAALAPVDGGIPSISLITDELVQGVTRASTAGPSLASLHNASFENLFNGNASEFAAITDNYSRIIREFIIFPNDSQVLGRSGKLAIKKLVSRFSENSDIVGIIGCSNGPTNLAIGNEGLALGRAKRIAEEIVAAGVSIDKLFDEGCWSPTTDAPGFPNRGVVIDLWRRTS